jgi:hypothetical protein
LFFFLLLESRKSWGLKEVSEPTGAGTAWEAADFGL